MQQFDDLPGTDASPFIVVMTWKPSSARKGAGFLAGHRRGRFSWTDDITGARRFPMWALPQVFEAIEDRRYCSVAIWHDGKLLSIANRGEVEIPTPRPRLKIV